MIRSDLQLLGGRGAELRVRKKSRFKNLKNKKPVKQDTTAENSIKIFKNKTDFLDTVEKQVNFRLDTSFELLNKKRNLIYTEIPKHNLPLRSLLDAYNRQGRIYMEHHLGEGYFIRINNKQQAEAQRKASK